MNVFTQKFNRITGNLEWITENEEYDYHQEVARSSYADMLHDEERNHKYFIALEKAIRKLKKQGKPTYVLDIGTGTGLLAMMAAQIGADGITACEAFLPVAKCARTVIKNNGFEEKINLIEKRSTELSAGPGGDLEKKANILVTEVFDTELIGEGALSTFSHALKNLMEADSIVIPSGATVYAQVVSSDALLRWNKLQTSAVQQNVTIVTPSEISNCPGAAAVHDIQMAQISTSDFIPLTKPVPVFEFDFTGKKPLQMEDVCFKELVAESSGKCDAVFMWWELKMDSENSILSCAPPWAHPNRTNMQWRDHWMQAIYYLPTVINVNKQDTFKLHSYHDEYSLWFDVTRNMNSGDVINRPVCSCSVHVLCSRTRLGMLNDPVRNKAYIEALKKIVNSESVCLYVGDFSLLPLIASKLGAKQVFVVQNDNNHISKKVFESYITTNHLSDKIKIISKNSEDLITDDIFGFKVNVLLSEPFFSTCILPWDSLHFLYQHAILKPHLTPDVVVMPQKIVIKAIAVEFQHLWKIRAPVHAAQGFNLSAFDKMIQEAIAISDEPVEPHPLWEYPCKALTNSFDVLTFTNFINDRENKEIISEVKFLSKGICNGIALWVDYHLDEQQFITTGPIDPATPGKEILWDKYCRQGVYFISNPVSVRNSTEYLLTVTSTFNPKTGSLNFSFIINNNTQD